MFSEIMSTAASVVGTLGMGIILAELAPTLLSILTSLLAELAKTLLLSTLSSLLPWILVAIIIWQIYNKLSEVYESRK